jgi:tRNA-specific 2-thiouridylase
MHEGICDFTIGQRRGLGIGAAEALYVLAIEPETRTVVVGHREELLKASFLVEDLNWISDAPGDTLDCDVKIRYAHTPARARVSMETPTAVRVVFDQPQSAVTPGQVAAFMRDDVVLGGGNIVRDV